MSDDPYVYAGTGVLRNKLDIQDANELDRVERQLAWSRIQEGIPQGDFDLKHLKAIHRHLFQDLYEWAGQVRLVEISKGESQFQFRQYIETGMADVHRRIVNPISCEICSDRYLWQRLPVLSAT
ncbi:Fic/DOC family protein [Neorhizobium vignae]|uniref:Fic/DOC family protein n=1 Tax=Neorhizobium vignae TaxID=690585 RepID=UPI00191C4471|nr:Fic family protein [Neorhizobium vignae]